MRPAKLTTINSTRFVPIKELNSKCQIPLISVQFVEDTCFCVLLITKTGKVSSSFLFKPTIFLRQVRRT